MVDDGVLPLIMQQEIRFHKNIRETYKYMRDNYNGYIKMLYNSIKTKLDYEGQRELLIYYYELLHQERTLNQNKIELITNYLSSIAEEINIDEMNFYILYALQYYRKNMKEILQYVNTICQEVNKIIKEKRIKVDSELSRDIVDGVIDTAFDVSEDLNNIAGDLLKNIKEDEKRYIKTCLSAKRGENA